MSSHERGGAADALGAKFTLIAQYVLVGVFGLLPVFFIPTAAAPFIYSKIFLVVIAVFAALFLSGFALLRSGNVRLWFSWLPVTLWMMTFIALVSALLSGDIRDALVGEAFEVHTVAFLALMALAASAWTYLVDNRAAIMHLFIVLALSTFVLSFFHVLRLVFGQGFLSFGVFDGSALLSPLGSWNDLGIFFGLVIILSLVALEQLRLTTVGKTLFGLVVAVALIMLAVINFFAVWVILGLISLAVLIYGLTKDRFAAAHTEMRPAVSGVSIGISLAVLVASIVFVLGGATIGGAVSRMTGITYTEVRPSFTATVDITRNVYASEALFGIGPNRFTDAWRLHKDASINDSIFWATDFPSGFGYVPTFFVTTGILGGIMWLVFFGMYLFTGLRMLLRTTMTDRTWYFIGTASFVGGFYIWCMTVVYVPGAVLLLTAALCTGLVAASSHVLMPQRVRELATRGNRRMAFVFVVGFLVLILGSVFTLYTVGRHYVGVYTFNQGLVAMVSGGSLEQVEQKAVAAFEFSRDDLFARRLAEYQVARMEALMGVPEPTEEQRQQFSNAFSTGINAAQVAVNADKTDPRNWNVLANMYAALVPAKVEGSYDRAREALDKAREFDPHNPLRVLSLGQLAFAADRKDEARPFTEESLAMKRNYSDAIFFLAQLDVDAGNIAGAIDAARAITILEPQNPLRFFQLGLLQFSDRRYADAAANLEQALALDAQYANARYYLALTYSELNRAGDARAELNTLLETNSDNALVTELLGKLDRGERLVNTVDTAAQAVPEEPQVSEENGSVTTDEDTDTPLVTPVNTPSEGAPVE